ncbi:PREDICTED: EF-hand calcium-binding domain-containing protein 12 [Gavialis gangeticus]|uniref:EF-hand calcium-binding domain-containing protein 12 n=1 Tax=Gavialis gangeticus TaxID=94835 RepID=UPI00092FB411|nr:PREDICTED: EF-hand calcium-binding domain-containing protein 12 [Gavialis gangeticus]
MHEDSVASSLAIPSAVSNDGTVTEEDLSETTADATQTLILPHWFKQSKSRKAYLRSFHAHGLRPPQCPRRIIIAPPMPRPPYPCLKLAQPSVVCQKEEATPKQEAEVSPGAPEDESDTEEKIQKFDAWILERRRLNAEVEGSEDFEERLKYKVPLNKQEKEKWEKIKASRPVSKAESQPAEPDDLKSPPPKRRQSCRKGVVPVINVPYPHALVLLLYLLRKKKLRMVDLFKKSKMTSKNITREEFFKVIQATGVPITDKELEDAFIYLTTSAPKPRNFVCSEDIVKCQRMWMPALQNYIRDRHEERLLNFIEKATAYTVEVTSAAELSKLTLLEVPPVNTEECRPMTDEDIEEVGKHYREWRRLKKVWKTVNPLEWAEQCRLVRCGDRAVDDHCLPSMMEGEVAESVNRYRQVAHQSYVRCVKLCKEQNIPVTEDTLAKVLLHPGDRIIKEGKHMLKIRQPGAYYNPIPGGGTFQVHPWTGGGVLKRSWKVEEEAIYGPYDTQREQEEKQKAWISSEQDEPESLEDIQMKQYEAQAMWMSSKRYVLERPYDTDTEDDDETVWITPEVYWQFQSPTKKSSRRKEKRVRFPEIQTGTGNTAKDLLRTSRASDAGLRRNGLERQLPVTSTRYCKTENNRFWPGQQLDKLCYLPQTKPVQGQAMFKHIQQTKPAYPSIYNPYRSWPINERGYLTYGDIEIQKKYSI